MGTPETPDPAPDDRSGEDRGPASALDLLDDYLATKEARIDPAFVRTWRRRRGLSQADLALLLGTTRMAIYRWERGETMSQPRMLALSLMALQSLVDSTLL
jgi:DNA-binding transcriptional regulator YiaG